mmetsp:Transcript_30074/g.48062  ORF Transcript_30074/g.48062 Transcript_30074/m.48062 type:complete len:1141 (+) Transcript_30074:31-3453(+)
MSASQLSVFKSIDHALELYYERLGSNNYLNANGNGIFLQYIIDEELNDVEVPIEDELGDACNPNDCAYSWMDDESTFPLPPCAERQITSNAQKEAFIFYLLQYCYKHREPPSDEYIRGKLIPKCIQSANEEPLRNAEPPDPITTNKKALDNVQEAVTLSASYSTESSPSSSPVPDISVTSNMEKTQSKQRTNNDVKGAAPIAFTQLSVADSLIADVSSMSNASNVRRLSGLNIPTIPIESDYQPQPSLADFEANEDTEGVPAPPAQCQPARSDVNAMAEVQRINVRLFAPKYPPRAHLNIFTAKDLTKGLIDIVAEKFENHNILYYYTDITTAMQMNDRQMKEFTILYNGQERKLSLINYDLHFKSNGQPIYGVIVPNDSYKIQQDKWLWKVAEIMTADQIVAKYKIDYVELPQSSRKMQTFLNQLKQKLVIEESLVDRTDWFNVQQIKSLKRHVKAPKVTITLSKEMWIAECRKSFQNDQLPLIPVVVNKNNSHWIEWVKIVNIESQNVYIGISCKFDESSGLWSVQSVCLDRGDIYNKYRLVGMFAERDRYLDQLRHFKTSITEIRFSDNDNKDQDKKINVLKQQIRSQQESIVRLKESLLRAKNANKCATDGSIAYQNKLDEDEKQSLQQHIREFVDEPQEEQMNGDEAWLAGIVDDVIKYYEVLDFKTSPIGAKRNIYIDKQFTKRWMPSITPRFTDEAMMYYWLDYTTAMQMCQGYSKQYIDKSNRKFIIAVINYELRDQHNNILYGIIKCDDDKMKMKMMMMKKMDGSNGGLNKKPDNKYPYKLHTFMTKKQIKDEYKINASDLPQQSRKNEVFINGLLLQRRIVKQDLNKINWSNLKLFKSQSTNNDPINKSVTITQKVMKEYCLIALERLNASHKKNTHDAQHNLIPIVVIDKHHNYYGIEWVLIVHIIHRNCDVGISFRFDEKNNLFVATAIYLDKGEIESKHKLIGLKFDYCKHLRPFSLRKFKFKSDRHSIIDDDDDMMMMQQPPTGGNGNGGAQCMSRAQLEELQRRLAEYKQAFEQEQVRNSQLKQSMQQNRQMFLHQAQALQQQHSHSQSMIQQQQSQALMQQQQQQQPVQYGMTYQHQPYVQQPATAYTATTYPQQATAGVYGSTAGGSYNASHHYASYQSYAGQ